MAFSSVLAWWFLSEKEKEALRNARASGMFGGSPRGHTYYGWLQEYGTYPAPGGGVAKGFIEAALTAVAASFERDVDDAIYEARMAGGFH